MSLAERYNGWSGTLSDLEREIARTIRAGDVTGINPPNGRLIRHYQAQRAVDPPGRGRAARYGRRQLLQALAVKSLLADGWALPKIAEITTVLTDEQLAETAATTGVSDGLREDEDHLLPAPALAESDQVARRSALDAVGALRGATERISDPAVRVAYTASMAKAPPAARTSELEAPVAAASFAPPSHGRVTRAYAPADWLNAYVDADALASLDADEIDQVADTLAAHLKADKQKLG